MNQYAGAAFVALAGLVLCFIPFAWMVWEAGHERNDLRVARRFGRVMIGTSALVFPVFLWLALPGYFQVSFGSRTSTVGNVPDDLLALIAACLTYFGGLAWMIRILRTSHVESETSSWRYREV